MYKRITICLTEPICSCKYKDGELPSWCLIEDKSLQVTCKYCKTSISVPYDKLVASFEYDAPAIKQPAEKPIPLGKLFGDASLFPKQTPVGKKN